MSLQEQFAQAQLDSKNLPERPDNMTLLKIYALFKQGSSGDVTGERPGFTDMVGRAKYDAWAALKGTSQDDAMQQYVDLIEDLKNAESAPEDFAHALRHLRLDGGRESTHQEAQLDAQRGLALAQRERPLHAAARETQHVAFPFALQSIFAGELVRHLLGGGARVGLAQAVRLGDADVRHSAFLSDSTQTSPP